MGERRAGSLIKRDRVVAAMESRPERVDREE
jgi:hypothetical protein